ncbi:hypothetical protein ACWKWU_07090 [Chitinophaga lutea]
MTGLIAVAIFGTTLVSCKDDDKDKVLRSKVYQMTQSATSTTNAGKVTAQEITDSTFDVTIYLNKTLKDQTYTFAILKGPKDTAVLTTLYDLGSEKSLTTNSAMQKKIRIDSLKFGTVKQKFNFDSLLKYRAFARVMTKKVNEPTVDSVAAIGNIGSAAQ